MRVGARALTQRELAGAAAQLATELAGCARVAIWAENELETAVAVVAALCAGVPAVPLNPKSGSAELGHIVADAAPAAILARPAVELPAELAALSRVDATPRAGTGARLGIEPPDDAPALIVYTSGTTGPPKGAVLPRRAIASNLDALAQAWEWTAADVVCHALPLFHVHGLVLGTLGPFAAAARPGTWIVLARGDCRSARFARHDVLRRAHHVPPHRRRRRARSAIGRALSRARLLVSGSAALPAAEHERLERLCGQRAIERYGMSETLMIASTTVAGPRPAGSVGLPLESVELCLRDDDGADLAPGDQAIGEVHVRGEGLLLEYLNRPDATAAAFTADGFFRTGDLGVRDPDGYLRLVGRRATDLIKSGGFKIGAGEIEAALLEHPAVAEAAVAGMPDDDLGERVCAWVVLQPDAAAEPQELTDHVAAQLAPHKRPRSVWMVDSLPRNAMGKVLKNELKKAGAA